MKAIVTEIQVGGGTICHSLEKACITFKGMVDAQECPRTKIRFGILLPNGQGKTITIRDEDGQTVAYGDFDGLPNFLDYAEEVRND